jgi:hypothetical protein
LIGANSSNQNYRAGIDTFMTMKQYPIDFSQLQHGVFSYPAPKYVEKLSRLALHYYIVATTLFTVTTLKERRSNTDRYLDF